MSWGFLNFFPDSLIPVKAGLPFPASPLSCIPASSPPLFFVLGIALDEGLAKTQRGLGGGGEGAGAALAHHHVHVRACSYLDIKVSGTPRANLKGLA